jgi:hypothetical protein
VALPGTDRGAVDADTRREVVIFVVAALVALAVYGLCMGAAAKRVAGDQLEEAVPDGDG